MLHLSSSVRTVIISRRWTSIVVAWVCLSLLCCQITYCHLVCCCFLQCFDTVGSWGSGKGIQPVK